MADQENPANRSTGTQPSRSKLNKHQHVVPRTYLRGWADERDHVAVLERGYPLPKRLPISHSAVRSRFYNYLGEDGRETDVVEEWLATHIESAVAPSLRALRAGAEVGDVDKSVLVNFTVAQLLRSPTVFGYMRQIDSHLGPLFVMMEMAKDPDVDLLALPESERQRIWNLVRDAWSEREDRDSRPSMLRTMMRKLDEIATMISSWHCLMLTSTHPLLITGDAPVVTLNVSGRGWSGLLPEGSPLWLPISPTQLLVFDPVRPLRPDKTLALELARVVSTQLAEQVDRGLFNRPGLGWPLDVHLWPYPPSLPEPNVRLSASSDPPSFPARFPEVSSKSVRELLDVMGAVDEVE